MKKIYRGGDGGGDWTWQYEQQQWSDSATTCADTTNELTYRRREMEISTDLRFGRVCASLSLPLFLSLSLRHAPHCTVAHTTLGKTHTLPPLQTLYKPPPHTPPNTLPSPPPTPPQRTCHLSAVNSFFLSPKKKKKRATSLPFYPISPFFFIFNNG